MKKSGIVVAIFNLFFEIALFFFAIITILFVYVGVILSHKPRSFPIITQKIEKILNEKLGEVKISNASLSLTRTASIRINLENFHKISTSGKMNDFFTPELDIEYSLPRLLLLQFYPHKIRIKDATINIVNKTKPDKSSINFSSKQVTQNIINAIKDGKINTKNFILENTIINYENDLITSKILLKKSQIKTYLGFGGVHFDFENQININNNPKDITFNSYCYEEFLSFACDLEVEDFLATSVADLHPKLNILKKIDGHFDVKAHLKYKDSELESLDFNIKSRVGKFFLPQFFAKEMNFTKLEVAGDIDNKEQTIKLEEISANFDKTKFMMSLDISNFKDIKNHQAEYFIKLENVNGNDISKFWPLFVKEQNIRSWVKNHITNGIIKDAYAKFTITTKNNISHLDDMDSTLEFSGLNLNYDERFPTIFNIDGEAKFNANAMKINLKKGEVLQSKISSGSVTIDNFHTKKISLNIKGQATGNAQDPLKHIDHQHPFFNDGISKYLNGIHKTNFEISLPLNDNTSFHDFTVKVNSQINNINTPKTQGSIDLNIQKNSASDDFLTEINFKNATLNITELGGEKDLNQDSKLFLTIKILDNLIVLKDIKFFEKTVKNSETNPQVTGEIQFEINPFTLRKITISNRFFDNNNYEFSYIFNKKTFSDILLIKGTELDLRQAIKFGLTLPKSGNNSNILQSEIKINLNQVHLANSKSLQNFNADLTCFNKICENGFVKASYFDNTQLKSILDFQVWRNAKDDFSQIKGTINNISYLADGFDISNRLSPSTAQINIKNSTKDGKILLVGNLKFKDDLIIYDNPKIKELVNKDSLLMQVKDALYADGKTIFNKFKMEFSYQDEILNINSLAAHNYKIGITAQGTINFNDGITKIEGLIIPSYVVNNLFSIGKIPIVGKVVSEVLTGGDENAGLFGIKYEYTRSLEDKEGKFKTHNASSVIPVSIRRMF